MSDNYDATLLEQLEDTEGENEILSLEVERLTNQLEAIQAKHDKEQMAIIEQLANLFPTQHGLSPEQYGAWLANKVRQLKEDSKRAQDDMKNGYIDVIISERATQMYHGDKNGMPDPTDRASYDQWMKNGMRTYYDAPMKNVYRTTRDDLVKEYFELCELLKMFVKTANLNYSYDRSNYSETLFKVAETRRLPLFKCWLGVQTDTKNYRPPAKPSYDPKNSIYLSCGAAGREDCERALTVLKRHVAKKKEKKKSLNDHYGLGSSDILDQSIRDMYNDILELNKIMDNKQKKMMYISTPSSKANKNGVKFKYDDAYQQALDKYWEKDDGSV